MPALANVFELEELIEETYGRTFDPFSYYLKGATSENDDRAISFEEHLLRKVRRVSDVVKVDYYLPGCPPARHLLENLVEEFKGKHPIEDRRQIVCSECLRKFNKPAGAEISVFPPQIGSETICMLSQGTLCLGFLTRGGCNAVCTAGGLPCWGCRGPSDNVIRKCGTGEPIEVAEEDSEVYRLTSDHFSRLCRENPGVAVKLLKNIAVVFSQRLRALGGSPDAGGRLKIAFKVGENDSFLSTRRRR